MECYYHPERESTDNCAICGKSICKECGLEIAGKTYCKECLEKIVGIGIENKGNETRVNEEFPQKEPASLERKPITETIYNSQHEEIPYSQSEMPSQTRTVQDDSPYNINYQGEAEDDYSYKSEMPQNPQIAQNEYDLYPNTPQTPSRNTQDYIYPDHRFDSPEQRIDLEDKYERYLDDLYYDENEIPLDEQLAKDEAQYGSLTRRPYAPRTEEALIREQNAQQPQRPNIPETPEEMEARIRAEILAEKEGKNKIRDSNIHNLNYKEEKEPRSIVDILLTIILVIIILIVVYYIIYIFTLQNAYPTFMDAIFGLTNPQNVISNLFSPQV